MSWLSRLFGKRRYRARRPSTRGSESADAAQGEAGAGSRARPTAREHFLQNYVLGLSEKTVHGIGHGETSNGKSPEEARDLIEVGAYVAGTNPRTDAAVANRDRLIDFLRQPSDLAVPFAAMQDALALTMGVAA